MIFSELLVLIFATIAGGAFVVLLQRHLIKIQEKRHMREQIEVERESN